MLGDTTAKYRLRRLRLDSCLRRLWLGRLLQSTCNALCFSHIVHTFGNTDEANAERHKSSDRLPLGVESLSFSLIVIVMVSVRYFLTINDLSYSNFPFLNHKISPSE